MDNLPSSNKSMFIIFKKGLAYPEELLCSLIFCGNNFRLEIKIL